MERAELRRALGRVRQELQGEQPGSLLVVQQLAYMVLVQALRLHVAQSTSGAVGWLFALADKPIGSTIACMRENPSYPWTLQELARRVGMSRSIFANRFKEVVGETPMAYLTCWRMLLASDQFMNSDESVTEVALSLGYESESAFRRAFRKVLGYAPRR